MLANKSRLSLLCIASSIAFAMQGCGNIGDVGVALGGTGAATSASNSTSSITSNDTAITAVGPITGFGSVIVNGIKFDDSAATVAKDASNILISNLRLGMTIEVTGKRPLVAITSSTSVISATNATADVIRVFSELKGPVQTVTAGSNKLMVLGISIAVDSSTVFDGISGISGINGIGAIKVGDSVEVYGFRNLSTNEITATRIEAQSAPATTTPVPVALKGSVAALDATLKTFTVNGQLVKYPNIIVTGNLANAAVVEVRGTAPSSGGFVTATSVSVATLSTPIEAQELVITGIVTDFVSRGQFKVNGTIVDASSANLSSGQIGLIANGIRCEVHGRVTQSILRATQIECVASGTSANTVYEISGSITAITASSGSSSSGNFTVRNQVIDASAATFSNGTASNLALAKQVQVKGPVVGGILKATTVNFQ